MCPNDPLVFTCEVNEAAFLHVILPTGEHESVSIGDSVNDVVFSAGFTADSLVITSVDDFRRNISLTFSIVKASLLNGARSNHM